MIEQLLLAMLTICVLTQPTVMTPLSNEAPVQNFLTNEELLQNFLINDVTNERLYSNNFPYFTCGHFTEQLIRNASKDDITLYPVFLFSKYGTNHIIAATKMNDTWTFLEPMSDQLFTEAELKRNYKGYKIGETITCSPYSRLNWVDGFIESKMWS